MEKRKIVKDCAHLLLLTSLGYEDAMILKASGGV